MTSGRPAASESGLEAAWRDPPRLPRHRGRRRSQVRDLSRSPGLEQRNEIESSTEGTGRRQGQPTLEERGVDAAEVDLHLQVAILEVEEVRRLADEAGPD